MVATLLSRTASSSASSSTSRTVWPRPARASAATRATTTSSRVGVVTTDGERLAWACSASCHHSAAASTA